ENFPSPEKTYLEISYDLAMKVQDVNHAIWKYKKNSGMRLNEPLKRRIYLPADLALVKEELVDLHHLESIEFYSVKPPENTVDIGYGVYVEY
ncbi:MAG: valine--tRNA ligase, partial [Desulfurococcaceae archaeon]